MIGLAAAIVVLLIAFGSVIAMGLPVLIALLGLRTAFGLIGLASHLFDMPSYSKELAAMIGLGVGIDYDTRGSPTIVRLADGGRGAGTDNGLMVVEVQRVGETPENSP